MPVVLPHELVPELARKGLLPAADVDKFWTHAASTGVDWGREHPATHRHRPMGLYGDDCQFDENQNALVVVTLNDILSEATHSMASTWPLFVLRDAYWLALISLYIFSLDRTSDPIRTNHYTYSPKP